MLWGFLKNLGSLREAHILYGFPHRRQEQVVEASGLREYGFET